jgi:hypothetical protein
MDMIDTTTETFTCPSCGVSGLTAAELRSDEIAGEWIDVPCDDLLPPEYQGRDLVKGSVRRVDVIHRCVWCSATN